jgi:hypothetical protein
MISSRVAYGTEAKFMNTLMTKEVEGQLNDAMYNNSMISLYVTCGTELKDLNTPRSSVSGIKT